MALKEELMAATDDGITAAIAFLYPRHGMATWREVEKETQAVATEAIMAYLTEHEVGIPRDSAWLTAVQEGAIRADLIYQELGKYAARRAALEVAWMEAWGAQYEREALRNYPAEHGDIHLYEEILSLIGTLL